MYGIDPEIWGWFRTFLCGRIQQVVVDGEEFKEMEITSGVPQGSVLGPTCIFFLIYTHAMAEYTKHSSVRLFADNTIIYLTLTAEND